MMEWFPWFPLDFRRDTLQLSLAADGAYRRLIDEYMMQRNPLPNDDAALARILGVALPDWLAVAPAVKSYFRSKDGKLFHKRCERELRAQDLRTARNSERGKKAAFIKYNKINGKDARRMLTPPTLTKKERLENLSVERRDFREAKYESLSDVVKRKGWA
jgi:uncharacterized protein YdaU (DUF1376 family)